MLRFHLSARPPFGESGELYIGGVGLGEIEAVLNQHPVVQLESLQLTPNGKVDPTLSLYQLLDAEILANPYPLYHRLRSEDPVHWNPFLHEWVVTRYADVMTVFQDFSANRTPNLRLEPGPLTWRVTLDLRGLAEPLG